MPLHISKIYFIQRKGTLYREKAYPAEIIKWIKVLQSMPLQPSKYQNNLQNNIGRPLTAILTFSQVPDNLLQRFPR